MQQHQFQFPVVVKNKLVTELYVTYVIIDNKVMIDRISYFGEKQHFGSDIKPLLQAISPNLYSEIESAAFNNANLITC